MIPPSVQNLEELHHRRRLPGQVRHEHGARLDAAFMAKDDPLGVGFTPRSPGKAFSRITFFFPTTM
jgi:hypothetical protein